MTAPTIWGFRLQALWVVFTGTYVLLGDQYPFRWVSSAMVTLGSLLIAATLLVALVERHPERVRSVLLVALGSCGFLAVESAKSFHDYIATAFTSIFCLMLLQLMWEPTGSLVRSDACRRYFVVIVLTSVTSLSQLAVTMIFKFGITGQLVDGAYLFAPHGLAVATSFGLGIALGSSILVAPRRQPLVDRLWRRGLGTGAWIVVFLCPVLALSSARHFEYHDLGVSTPWGLAAVWSAAVAFVLGGGFVWSFGSSPGWSRVNQAARFCLAAPLAAVTLGVGSVFAMDASVVETLWPTPGAILLFEVSSLVSFSLALVLAIFLARQAYRRARAASELAPTDACGGDG